MTSVLSQSQRTDYDRDGYVIVRGFFDPVEANLLQSAIEQDPAIRGHFYNRGDAEGLTTKMATWNHPGDSVYGLAARSAKMVDTMEDLLGGEVYHYHSKITAKEPHEGGAWEWHQDYGYWYNNGCLFPYMASAMTALDDARRRTAACRCSKDPIISAESITDCLTATRSAQTCAGSRRRQNSSTWSTAKWNRGMSCSSIAIPCTAPTRIAHRIAAGH